MLLPAVGGFPFGRRPKVLLAVGELFVRARSARSQARSACVIARRRRVSIRPKVLLAVGELFVRAYARSLNVLLAVGELFVRVRCARSQAQSVCVFVRGSWVLIRPKASCFSGREALLAAGGILLLARRREAPVLLPAAGEF